MRIDRVPFIALLLLAVLGVTGWFVFFKREPKEIETAGARDVAPAADLPERPDNRDAQNPVEAPTLLPAEQRDDLGSDPRERILAILDLAREPTPGNTRKMLQAIFALPEPWKVMDGLVKDLQAGSLSMEQKNAALLAIETALTVMFNPKWMEHYGADHGPELVSTLISSLGDMVLSPSGSLAKDVGDRMVYLLSQKRFFTERYFADLGQLLDQEPLPASIERLVLAIAQQPGQEQARFLLSLLELPNAKIKAAAMGYLMKFDPTHFQEMAMEYIGKAGSPEDRVPFLKALASGLPSRQVLPILQQVARADADVDIGGGVMTYLSLFMELVRKQPPDDVLRMIQAEPSVEVQRMLLSTINFSQSSVAERLLETDLPPELRGQAILTVSRFRPDAQVAQWAMEELRSGQGRVLSSGLMAAYNLALKAHGAGYATPLKSELSRLVNDGKLNASDRGDAFQALLFLLNDQEKKSFLGPDAPDYLKALVDGQ